MSELMIDQRVLGLEFTDVARLFFSRRNYNFLQENIKEGVFKITQTRIGDQSIEALVQIMRAVYLEDARYFTTQLESQCASLNKRCLEFCIPKIKDSMDLQRRNNASVFSNPTPIARPMGIATNNRGNGKNELEMKPWF